MLLQKVKYNMVNMSHLYSNSMALFNAFMVFSGNNYDLIKILIGRTLLS